MTTQTIAGGDATRGQAKLRALIEERGLDPRAAADEIGLSDYYVRQICAGRMSPGKNAQVKIAQWSRPKGKQAPLIGLEDWLTEGDRALLVSKAS